MSRPLNDSEYLYGLHDPGGEQHILDKGIPGWVLVTEALGFDRGNQSGGNYTFLSDRDLGVMVRLNAGYGGVGTIPPSQNYDDFALRCANFVRNSQGAHIWIIGNEMNHPIEWPGADWDWGAAPPQPREGRAGEMLTPERYARCFTKVRTAIRALPGHEEDQVIPGAVAPWNNLTQYPGNENGDWVKYFADLMELLGPSGCDGISLHTYSHGPAIETIWADTKMGPPFQHRHYHFRTYRDFMYAIPGDMRHLPVYITETDQDEEWRNENTGWVQRAYGEIDNWNRNNAQKIRSLILYRWPKIDRWYIEGKQGVIEDFRQAMNYRYKWDVGPAETITPKPEPAPEKEGAPKPETQTQPQPYRAEIKLSKWDAQYEASSEITVDVIVRNTGNNDWPSNGSNPVRLGYHWYDGRGQKAAYVDHRTALPMPLKPGESATLPARIGLPETPGAYTLRMDMVHEGITWFDQRGSTPAVAKATVIESTKPAPKEQYFPESKVTVRGLFLDFYRKYGLDICGYPITEQFDEGGMAVQYFQRVALEEYAPGKVRLRLTAAQALEASKRISALEAHVLELTQQLRAISGIVPKPEIIDIAAQLPRDPARMFTRAESDIKFLVIHHTAVTNKVPIERVAQAHRRQWPAIVCQYYVDVDGKLYQTNAITEVVDTSEGWVINGINIHVAGNFTDATPTVEQMTALAWLSAWLINTYHLTPEDVRGAKEFLPTQSPGRQWDTGQQWRNQLLQQIALQRGAGSAGRSLQKLQEERDHLARQVQGANSEIGALMRRISALEVALKTNAMTAQHGTQPAIADIINTLPRDPERMIKRMASDIRYVVIHHTGVSAEVDLQRVAEAHCTQWPAFMGQFFIDAAGGIKQTNPLLEVVDNEQMYIFNGINVFVAGNFDNHIPNEAQLRSLAALCAWLLETYSLTPDAVRGAREFLPTRSPGQQWATVRRWRDLLLAMMQTTPKANGVEPRIADDQALSLNQQLEALRQTHELTLQRLQRANEELAQWQQYQRNDNTRAPAAVKTQALTEPSFAITSQVVVEQPQMVELVDKLPKHPTNRYESRPLSDITHITIHHSAAPATISAERIALYHVQNAAHQWPGIGYHYYIEADGTIDHTQDLALASYHVYRNNAYTIGVCVAGNFTDALPTPAQIDSTARLVAWLMQEFNISIENVKGHKEFPNNSTACPGRQWLEDKKWKTMLLDRVRAVSEGQAGPAIKTLEHYLLFWQHPNDWARPDWEGAVNYIGRFRPTAGFSVDDARNAQYVTIIGGVAGVSQQAEDDLRASGCRVERLAGKDFADTKAMLDRLAESGRRFLTF